MSAPRQGAPSVREMIAAGIQITSRQRRLALALYLVQLFVSLLFLVIVERALASTFGHRPLFAHAVAGNTEALLLTFGPGPFDSNDRSGSIAGYSLKRMPG